MVHSLGSSRYPGFIVTLLVNLVNVCYSGGMTVNTNKLKEALAELQHQKAMLDGAITQLQNIVATVNGSALRDKSSQENGRREARTYIDEAVTVLEMSGQPLHISKIAEKIGEIRNREIARASVESSIIRHASSLGNRARIVKVRRGFFGLPLWKAIAREPQSSNAA